MKIAIIGSGIAGLSAAARLAHVGHAVTVFEQASGPGGKLSEFRLGGFRFDRGPSLFTMPQYVEDLFRACHENLADHFQYKKLDVNCAYFYEDGTQFKAYHDREQFAASLRDAKINPAPVMHNLDRSRQLYGLVGSLFMEQSLELKNFINLPTLKALLRLPFYKLNTSMHDANAEMLDDARVVQYFDRFATYNGSDPYQAPAMLQMIPHIEHGIGAFFPTNGMFAITHAIYLLAKRNGAQFEFDATTEKIETRNKRAAGVVVNGESRTCDVVISNMDMTPTYRHLLKHEPAPEKLLSQEKSSSALIFYWGIRQEFSQLELHNIFFATDYRAEFDDIFKNNRIHPDPTVYINITSKEKPDDAPPGCENWFVMINVPNHRGQNWDEWTSVARKAILQKLSRLLKTDIAPLIAEEAVWTPEGIETLTSSYQGSLYGNASNSKMAAFLRHRNYSSDIKGLYFCGGSVHPGGGIPLCLLSGKITAELVLEHGVK
jgi:phytoene desaturase